MDKNSINLITIIIIAIVIFKFIKKIIISEFLIRVLATLIGILPSNRIKKSNLILSWLSIYLGEFEYDMSNNDEKKVYEEFKIINNVCINRMIFVTDIFFLRKDYYRINKNAYIESRKKLELTNINFLKMKEILLKYAYLKSIRS